MELLDETGAANVGGIMDAQGVTAFEQAVAHAYTTRLGLGGSAFHLGDSPAGPAETVFLGVFRKSALALVGGFDESMWRAQDWELNYRLRRAGQLIWFSPDLRVTYRPRSRSGSWPSRCSTPAAGGARSSAAIPTPPAFATWPRPPQSPPSVSELCWP